MHYSDYIDCISKYYCLQNDNLKELLHIDLSWEADDWKGKEEDAEAHNSSRILVNMHQIKQQISDSIQHVSTKLSCNDLGTEVHKYYSVLDISTANLSSLSVPPWVSKIFKMKSHLGLLVFFTLTLVWYSEQNMLMEAGCFHPQVKVKGG